MNSIYGGRPQVGEIDRILFELSLAGWKILDAGVLADEIADGGERYNVVLLALVETTHLPRQRQFGVIACVTSPRAPTITREVYDRLLPLCQPLSLDQESH